LTARVLHLLSQRPLLTGSGVTLDALVRRGARAGWGQEVVIGVPASERDVTVGGLGAERVRPLLLECGDLDFPVPGMSDVMPYGSTRFSEMTAGQLAAYRAAWLAHLRRVVKRFEPDVIHSHHAWIMSSLVKDVAPEIPVVCHCHATGLRQMQLCPHLAEEVGAGCRRIERFIAQHERVSVELEDSLRLDRRAIRLVVGGFDESIFNPVACVPQPGPQLAYIGKYSAAKGLPWLLDAVERLEKRHTGLRLHVAGSGSGAQADELRRRMQAMSPLLVLHGQLDQLTLAGLLRECAVCVLPSFYEGVPLVLAEARAAGCMLVATRLPGITAALAPHLGDDLLLVEPPRLEAVDRPLEEDLPAFVDALVQAVDRALERSKTVDRAAGCPGLSALGWDAVFGRIEEIWRELLA